MESIRFIDGSSLFLTADNPVAVRDVVSVGSSGPYTFAIADFLANDLDFQEDNLLITSVSNAVNGSVQIDGSNIIFTPNDQVFGVMSFDYQLQDSQGNDAQQTQTVYINPGSLPEDPFFYDQNYLFEMGIVSIWQDYQGSDIDVGVLGKSDDLTSFLSRMINSSRDNQDIIGVAYESDVTQVNIINNPSYDLSSYEIANVLWMHSTPYEQDGNLESALQNAVDAGRGGLGTIVVGGVNPNVADGRNSNDDLLSSTRHVVTVAGQSPGASVLVAAPQNIFVDIPGVENSHGDFLEHFSGDMFDPQLASSLVAGVVALMLEANPNLGWRDVQEILAVTAVKDNLANEGWQNNGARYVNGYEQGLSFHHQYGFGLVDARAAVRLAETWQLSKSSQNELSLSESRVYKSEDESEDGLEIKSGVLLRDDTISIESDFVIDNVDVQLDIFHNWLGDLIVELVSPSGTVSTLINRPGKDPEDDNDFGSQSGTIRFSMNSKHFLGEQSDGTWILNVRDVATGDDGTLNSWTLNLYGHDASDDDVYIFTDEFNQSFQLDDDAGENTINASAVSLPVLIDLSGEQESSIGNNTFQINQETTIIKYVYGGDNNDRLIGNNDSNHFYGRRGNDTLTGGEGSDYFHIEKFSGTRDVITDFSVEDYIDFSSFDDDFSHHTPFKSQMLQVGDHVEITLSDEQVLVVENVQLSDLTYDRFIGNAGANAVPVASDVSVSFDVEDGLSTFNFNANDEDEDENLNSLSSYRFVNLSGHELGSIEVGLNGTFSYDPHRDYEDLSEGQTRDAIFQYIAIDQHGAESQPATITITVRGENDAPTVENINVDISENGLEQTFSFMANDVDLGDENSLIYTISNVPAGLGVVTNHGDGTFSFDPNSSFESLGDGESQDVVFNYAVEDSHGASSETGVVTITVQGENDAPTVENINVGISENGSEQTFSFMANDVDSGDENSLIYTISNVPADLGVVTNHGNGTFSFDPNSSFESLGDGESQDVVFNYAVEDSHGAGSEMGVATITVQGENDAPIVANEIDDQVILENSSFEMDLADNIFLDIDQNDVLNVFHFEFAAMDEL